MNNDLNMQLIEQLMVADVVSEKTVDFFCQQIHGTFESHLQSFAGLSLYQQDGETFVEQVRVPKQADVDKTLTPDKHGSILSAIQDKKHITDAPNIYLPMYKTGDSIPTMILCFIVSDAEERAAVRWALLHRFILREFQRLHETRETGSNVNERLQEQINIINAYNELTTFASRNHSEQALLDKGADILLNLLDIDHVGIMMIDDERKVANLVSDVPPQNASIQQLPVEGELWEKLARGEHLFIENVASMENEDQDSKEIFDAHGIQSALIIPFIDLSGKHIGSIGLDKFNGRINISDDQMQSARLISAQLVSHLQSLRLLQSSQRFANQMQQIAKFGETVQSRLELTEIFQTSLHFTNRILDVDYISIVLYDESQQKMIVRAYRQDGQDVILPAENPVMPLEDTVVGQVWRSREPVYIRHFKTDKYKDPFAKNIEVMYATSLVSRGITRGVIEVGRTQSVAMSELDRSVLSQLANQLAVGLENVTAYTQSQRLAQNKVLANEISLQLQQQMDMDSLLNTTITELGKALGAKRARIRLGVQEAIDKN